MGTRAERQPRAGGRQKAPRQPPLGTGERALERALARIKQEDPIVSIFGSGSAIGKEGISALAEALVQQRRIVHLQLRGNKVGNDGALRIAEALKGRVELQQLDLSENAIGKEGALHLSRALPTSTSLSHLLLQNNVLGDAGATHLAGLLARSPELEVLELGGNTIQEVGAASLAEAMEKQTALRVLGLERNSVGNTGVASLAGALGPGCALKVLRLGENGISDAGAAHLAQALDSHPRLQELELNDNRITDSGALSLFQSLERHSGLRALLLERNQIGDEAALELVMVLARMERDDIACNLLENPVQRLDAATLTNVTIAAKTVRSLSRRGMRLKHILLLWKDITGSGVIDGDTATTVYTAAKIVKPEMAKYNVCYGHFHHAPQADTYVIHPWTGLMRDLVQAVAAHATGEPNPSLDPDHLIYLNKPESLERSYYIDLFTVDPNVTAAFGDPRCEVDKFDLVLSEFRRRRASVLLVADPEYLVLTRLWCLTEAQCAVQHGMPLEVSFGAIACFPRKRQGTRMLDAEVLEAEDRSWLLGEIEARGVGCDGFDAQVTRLLEATLVRRYRVVFGLLPQHKQEELDWLEAQDNAREDLILATADSNIKLLSKCISYAEEVQIEQTTIRAGMRKRATLMLSDAADLTMAALQKAKETAEEMVEAARKQLPELEYEARLAAALKQLQTALEGSRKVAAGWGGSISTTALPVDNLEKAIPEAVEADVSEELIAESRERLAELLAILACKRDDLVAMEQAIGAATKSGVHTEVIRAASLKLARKKLLLQMDAGDPFALMHAIQDAEQVRLDAKVVAPALTKLEETSPEAMQLLTLIRYLSHVLGFLEVGKITLMANICTWLRPLPVEQVDPDLLQRAASDIKRAVEMAEDAGLDEELLVEPRRDLAEVERARSRRDARARLASASKGFEVEPLRDAIEAARKAEVEEVPLQVAERRLADLDLRAATESGDADDLQESIEIAKRAGVKVELVEAAKLKLSEVDFDAYRRILVVEMKLASEGEDIDILRHTMARALEAGVQGEELEFAEVRLAELELSAAVAAGELEGLLKAIDGAVEKNVAEEQIEVARIKLVEVRLVAATAESNVQDLIGAIEKAKEIKLGVALITKAEKKLRQLQLLAAMKSRDIQALQEAIDRLVSNKEEDENLQGARKKLAELRLNAAASGDNADALRMALKTAKELGVREAALTLPRKRLLLLDLIYATGTESIPILTQALEAATSGGVVDEEALEAARVRLVLLKLRVAARETDGDALLEAIMAAKQAGVAAKDVQLAAQKLQRLDLDAYMELASTELTAACEGTDVDVLAQAIEVASKAGVDASQLALAKRRLAELKISMALESSDDVFVREAIAMAEAAELDAEEWPIEAARKRLSDMEGDARRQAAHARLQRAMEGIDLTELKNAIKDAQQAGVDKEEIEKAKSQME